MGLNYSKVMCANETKQCRYGQNIPQQTFLDQTVGKTDAEKQEFVCKRAPGVARECCDPFDPLAAEVVKEKTNKVKIDLDKNGKYTAFYVCKCKDQACEDKNCPGFKQPTQYEKCRIRAVDKANEEHLSDFVYKVLPANTYTNCYKQCE